MEQLTKDQQIENCLLALWRWADVEPRHVDLSDWKCGTQACFGGHLCAWPEFKQMGVEPYSERFPEPNIPTLNLMDADVVSHHLFGVNYLFYFRRPWRNEHGDDHAIVVNRLEQRIAELSA